MAQTLSFGLDVGVYGRLATQAHILEAAMLAEESGFTSVWVADHVIFPVTVTSRYPYNASGVFPVDMSYEPLLEPIATMGVLAGATKRVRIGVAVLVMPYRNPVLLGRMLVTLDVLSGGRITLGAGVGWLEEEFKALDARDFAARGAVTDECLEIVRRLCAGGEVSFAGAHYQLDPVVSAPGSVQRPHIPILIGGTTRPALERTARLGDGWLSTDLQPAKMAERLGRLRGLCAEHGRDYGALDLTHKLFIDIGHARRGRDGERAMGTGSAVEVADDLRLLAELGFRHVIIRYRGGDEAEQRRQLRVFIDEIMPKF